MLSLLLCVATAVMWVRSYHGFDAFLYVGTHNHFSATTTAGKVVLQVGSEFHLDLYGVTTGFRSGLFPTSFDGSAEEQRKWPVWLLLASYYDRTPAWLAWTGMTTGSGPHTPDYPPDFRQTVAIVPFGYWIGLFALPPLFVTLRLFLRFCRRREGHCVQCGYDLRATPDRCPECGTIPAATAEGRA